MAKSLSPNHQHPKGDRQALKIRLRKIAGQLRGIEQMLDEDLECSEILTQLVSARKALKSFAEQLIQSHMHHCIEDARTMEQSKTQLRSLLTVLERYIE